MHTIATSPAQKGAGMDLTALVVDALGKRIEDTAAIRLANAIGKKPLKSATLANSNSHIADRKRIGVEIVASMILKNRAYWPYRKDGRRWVTWVQAAFLYPNYKGILPDGFDWQMDEAALSARFERVDWKQVPGLTRFELPAPGPGLVATVTVDIGDRPRSVYLAVEEEWPYATVYPESKIENCIEDAFFATWCAFGGLLREARVGADALTAIRERKITPFAFFSTALDGLLWSGDVKPELQPFCKAYMGTIENSEANALQDVKNVFGEKNYWRKDGDPKTPDDWVSYDRIASRFAARLAEWRRGIRWTMSRKQSF
jgi:hypothetical protein